MVGITQFTKRIHGFAIANWQKKVLLALAFACLFCPSAFSESNSAAASSDTLPTLSFWESPTLTGDWLGIRQKCEDQGITFPINYTVDILGNPLGGVSQGVVYTGNLTIGTNIDFQKLLGWEGASFGTLWTWMSGQDLSQNHVHNLLTIDGMAGFQTFRVTSLWLQQNWFADKISLRAGVLALDNDFANSLFSSLFINSAFGWPPYLSNNIPNGGPGTPIGTPGAQLAIHPTNWFTYQTVIAQGDVYPQNVNRHGFRWRFKTGLFLQEAIFHLNPSGKYWGNYRIGSWIFCGNTPSPFDEHIQLRSNYGFYFTVDQMLFPTSLENKNQGLAAFCRVAYAPPRTNNFPFYIDGGFTYTGPFSFRANDSLGIAVGYGQLSRGAVNAAMEGLGPIHSRHYGELILEATYSFQVSGWMAIQPDVQYIVQPGGVGGIPNALVLGMRASINF